MKFIKVLTANLLAVFVLLVLLITVVSFALKSITRHGEALTVPNITGLNMDKAIALLEEKKLRYLVIDSLYFDDKPKLSILDQNPSPESKVKEGRIVYLVINSDRPPGVLMPNIIDVSLRQAEAILKSTGLKPGELIYKPDIAQNVVLDQLFMGKSIQPGMKIPKGSTIDLVLGDGLVNAEDVPLPDLVGLTLEEANNLLSSASLSLGAKVYMGAVTDSMSVKIVRQSPAYAPETTVKAGQPIDVYLKQ